MGCTSQTWKTIVVPTYLSGKEQVIVNSLSKLIIIIPNIPGSGFGNTGEKFKYAAQCERISTVRPQWLFDSVDKQEVQLETEYYVHPEGMFTLNDSAYSNVHFKRCTSSLCLL